MQATVTNGVRRFYEFGPFRLDANRHRLLRNGEVVPLSPKALETLTLLVQNPGKLLEREALMDALWPKVVVEDANLTVAISQLRKAINQNADKGEFIQTIPRVGYRFAGEVKAVEEKPGPLQPALAGMSQLDVVSRDTAFSHPVEPFPDNSRALGVPMQRKQIRWRRFVIAGVSLLVLAVISWLMFSAPSRKLPVTSTNVKTMAVLPFKVLSGDPADEYIGIGLADALITQISRIPQLIVRPTGAVQKYADTRAPNPLDAGRELRVDAVLDGTAQHHGEKLRVTVQLFRVSDGGVLWSQKFDRKFTDVFALQDAISQDVAKALVRNLSGAERELLTKRYTANPEAYQLYLKGRYFWTKRTAGSDLELAIKFFQQAIDIDPAYALGYSGLADCYAQLSYFTNHPFNETFPKAKELAEKALKLDNDLAEPHATLGWVLHSYYWDWARAEKEYKLALELKPDYATAHQRYGWYLAVIGKHDQSVQEMKHALELDPVSLVINLNVGDTLLFARRPDEALKYYEAALEMDPKFSETHQGLGRAYLQKGEFERAIMELQKARELSHDSVQDLSQLGTAYALGGKTENAMSVLAQLEAIPNVPSYIFARLYVCLGEKEKALASLQEAYRTRSSLIIALKADSVFDPLRNEPGFQNILNSIGLTP